MSVHASTRAISAPAANGERLHRIRLRVAWCLATALAIALAVHGFSYYTLDAAHRPLSAKHAALKPSGAIGVKLGLLGFLMFLAIYLYPVRKRWPWLARQGSSRHWLDFHVLLGLSAPVVIAFHSSFKFHGIAGMAFWTMTAVALSGVVGRYLYAQIPRSLSAAEVSLKELQEAKAQLTQELSQQRLLSAGMLSPLSRLPSSQQVESMSLLQALGAIIALDLERPLHVSALRWRASGAWGRLISLGGWLPTGNARLEGVIQIARKQASLSKRILFLSRSQQVFHLWHVVHRPFSYAFAILASIHIVIVMMMGYL